MTGSGDERDRPANGTESGLRTVRVPAGLEGAFARAEKAVSEYFAGRRDDPERGVIDIAGERYVLVRAASLSVEFFSLVRDLFGPERGREADAFARNLLFDLAHAIGRSDARRFHARMGLEDPIERLAAGPVHFSHAGWAFVHILPESRPVADESYYIFYEHPYSFEADAWLAARAEIDLPVCVMNAGYSSGWCQESFGVRLVASELFCRACGDDVCRFVMAPPDRIERHIESHLASWPPSAVRRRRYSIPDLFARKRLEEELRHARDELEARVRERTADLERANAQLRKEMAAREEAEKQLVQADRLEIVGRLAGSIAHDFNNLMGVVIGHASHLESRVEGESVLRSHLAEIRRAGEEAAQLTQQLLAFSRAGMMRVENVDVNGLVRETMYMLERIIGENVHVVMRLDQDVGAVRGDRGQLRQVLMNLVVNARDAMPEGGTLAIETTLSEVEAGEASSGETRTGPWVAIAVTDSGIGMDAETLKRAFEPFFTTKQPGIGTGLGLSTVQRIVEQHGGTVAVSSTPGQGATFRIHLPRAGDAFEACGSSEDDAADFRGDETILVVEDLAEMRRFVAAALVDRGYSVLEAHGPDQAIDLSMRHGGEIHLLLSDVIMPGMNGPDLAERISADRPHLKVLFMSGYSDAEILARGAARAAASILAKPFTTVELARRVRRALDS